jgi:hypothetical protein
MPDEATATRDVRIATTTRPTPMGRLARSTVGGRPSPTSRASPVSGKRTTSSSRRRASKRQDREAGLPDGLLERRGRPQPKGNHGADDLPRRREVLNASCHRAAADAPGPQQSYAVSQHLGSAFGDVRSAGEVSGPMSWESRHRVPVELDPTAIERSAPRVSPVAFGLRRG